jgi:hypothetical protein
MSTTERTSEPLPAQAPPAPPPGAIPEEARDPDAAHPANRSGDTDLVFRLGRDVPLLRTLRARLDRVVEWLVDNRRILLAAGLVLAALVVLAQVIGGAYHHPPPGR